MNLNPKPVAPIVPATAQLLKADAYRTSHPTPAAPAIAGHHLVQPGECLTYWGLDRTLWGQQVVVTGLCPLDYHCRVEFTRGWTLTQVDEHGLWGAR